MRAHGPTPHRDLRLAQGNYVRLDSGSSLSRSESLQNTIHLNDLSVSRRHCLIKREPAQQPKDTDASDETGNQVNTTFREAVAAQTADFEFTLVDLESYNGTFVNGLPVHEQKLAHGDQIAVGDVLLLFLLREAEAGTTLPAPDEVNLITDRQYGCDARTRSTFIRNGLLARPLLQIALRATSAPC